MKEFVHGRTEATQVIRRYRGPTETEPSSGLKPRPTRVCRTQAKLRPDRRLLSMPSTSSSDKDASLAVEVVVRASETRKRD